MPLRWVYQARGGEQFMTIGMFKHHQEVEYVEVDTLSTDISYYFFDDVSVIPLPASIGDLGLGDTIFCELPFSHTLASTGSGPYGGYRWSTGDTTAAITITQPGVYVLEATYGEFVIRDTAVVQYLPGGVSDFFGADTSVCRGQLPLRLEAPYGMDGYAWNTGDTTPYLRVWEAGTYWVEAPYACGTALDTITVGVDTLPALSLGGDTLVCGDWTPYPLAAPPLFDSYTWGNGDTGPTTVAAQPGPYWLEATHRCGTRYDTINIAHQPLLSTGLPEQLSLCPGDTTLLRADWGFDSYLWADGTAWLEREAYETGDYVLTAGYACGEVVDTVRVEVWSPPGLGLPTELAIDLGEGVEIAATGGLGTYHWAPPEGLDCTDCPVPYARPAISTTYLLTVTSDEGCTVLDSVWVQVAPRARAYTPTAFSPNADGRNDVFQIYTGPELERVEQLEVYHRWGGTAYQGTDGWDGTSKGEPAPLGLYLWQARAVRGDGVVVQLEGEVMLVR